MLDYHIRYWIDDICQTSAKRFGASCISDFSLTYMYIYISEKKQKQLCSLY